MDTAETETRIDPARLLVLRKARHWTQDELSHAAAVSLRTVQRAEQIGRVSAATLKSLAAAFGVAAGDLEATHDRRSLAGGRAGLVLGYGGVLLGGILSVGGQVAGLRAGDTTPAELGISAGLTGVVVGLSCALIGVWFRRQRQTRG